MNPDTGNRNSGEAQVAPTLQSAARKGGRSQSPLSVRIFTGWGKVEPVWREIYSQSPYSSFFLSPEWVQTWVETFGHEVKMTFLVLEDERSAVGVCLIVQRVLWHGPFPLRHLFLNTVRGVSIGGVCAEYNNVLCLGGREQEVAAALAGWLRASHWDELMLSAMGENPVTVALHAALADLEPDTTWDPVYYVDLQSLRDSGGDFERTLSRKWRQHLRQSDRLYRAAYGEFSVRNAASVAEALSMLDELAVLHQRTWEGRGEPGSFASEAFRKFHRALIERAFPLGMVHLFRLSAGTEVVGYRYVFVAQDKIYGYQAGLQYRTENGHFRPGLTLHSFAVRRYCEAGLGEYDFLAGEAEYKRALSTRTRRMLTVRLRRPTIRTRAMSIARDVRRLFRPVAANGAPDSSRASSALQITVSESLDALEALRLEWEALLAETPTATIFSSWDWLVPWWNAFGADRKLRILAFRDSSHRLVGLAPLALVCRRVGGIRRRTLQLMGDGSGDSDNLDIPILPGCEDAVVAALLAYLGDSRKDWDLCEFNTFVETSPAFQSLSAALSRRGWRRLYGSTPGYAIVLPEDWESLRRQLSPKMRAQIAQDTRKVAKRYQAAYRMCESESELDSCLDSLFHLHQSRWNAAGGPGVFGSPERRRFYSELSRSLLRQGRLQLWFMDVDGSPAGAEFDFRYKDALYNLQVGADPAYRDVSVGHLLRAHVLERAMADGTRTYDFLAGVQEYKRRWCGQTRKYGNLAFARPWSAGSACLCARWWVARLKARVRVGFIWQLWRSWSGGSGAKAGEQRRGE
jgi:CelD/BcsL family acetyltransferase involved in cellulose biosynthesis